MSYQHLSKDQLINAYLNFDPKSSTGLWYTEGTEIISTIDSQLMKAVALSQSKGFTEFVPGHPAQSQDLGSYSLEFSVKSYEDGFGIPLQALKSNTELWTKKAAQVGRESHYEIQRLVCEHLNANRTSLDGTVTFSASHIIGNQAAQTNILTASEVTALNVNTPAAPTVSEAIEAILGVVNYMRSYKGENGRIVTAGQNEYVILVNTGAIYNAFSAAISKQILASGETNVLAAQVDSGKLKIRVELQTELSGSNTFWILGSTPGQKGLFLGVEGPEDISILDPNSEYARTHNQVKFGVKVNLGICSGMFYNIARAVLS